MDKNLLYGVAIGGVFGGIVTLLIHHYYRNQASSIVQENEETWEWMDWKGRPRKITVHRRVQNV